MRKLSKKQAAGLALLALIPLFVLVYNAVESYGRGPASTMPIYCSSDKRSRAAETLSGILIEHTGSSTERIPRGTHLSTRARILLYSSP